MAKTATKTPTGYTKLQRSDLKAWDTKAWEIVRDAQDMGWVFRVSSRGHAIGRSPDGKTTMSVAKSYDQKRTGTNARAEFERWKKEHDTRAAQVTKVKGAASSIIASLARNVINEYTEKSPDDVPETLKVMLKRMADQDDVAAYMADRIAMGRPAPMILTYDINTGSAEITEDSKPWHIQWVMADPDTHKVIGWGGPKMSAEMAADVVTMRVAAEAKAKAEAKQAAIDAATPAPRVLPPAPSMVRSRKKDPDVKMFACPEPDCEAVFEQQRSLNLHILSAHQPLVACPHCGREIRKNGLPKHIGACEQNPDANQTFECTRCLGVFKISGRGRHEAACLNYSPKMLREKQDYNRRKRGLDAPAPKPTPAPVAAATIVPLPEWVQETQPKPQTGDVMVGVTSAGAPVWKQPAGQGAGDGQLARLAASLPQIADPLSALMNLLAEVEELRAARPEQLQEQIEALTTERDEALKRAEEAEGKLATLKSVFG